MPAETYAFPFLARATHRVWSCPDTIHYTTTTTTIITIPPLPLHGPVSSSHDSLLASSFFLRCPPWSNPCPPTPSPPWTRPRPPRPLPRTRSATSWVIIAPLSHVVSFFLSILIEILIADQIVHCRRRKIRCLVAADDAHGRCENCIRLRKECQFFPVDQQPPIEKKSRPNSRLESASTDPSTASSSPPIISGRPDQTPHQHQHPPHPQPEPFFTYQPIPLSASQDMSGLPSTASFAPENPMSPFAPGWYTLVIGHDRHA